MRFVEDFIREIDGHWTPMGDGRVTLRVIGSTALFLQTDYQRGTKDSDVLETDEVAGPVAEQLVEMAGQGTALHRRHRMYVDIVGRAIPLLPWDPVWHSLNLGLVHFDIEVLDVHDVVVSKLRRFSSSDRDDVRAMVEGGHLDHERMCDRVRGLLERYTFDGRSDQLPGIVARFNRVERDWFGGEETEFEMSEHIFR